MAYVPQQRASSRIRTTSFTRQKSTSEASLADSHLTCFSRIDISDEFQFTHMLEFSKYAVGFVMELGSYRA